METSSAAMLQPAKKKCASYTEAYLSTMNYVNKRFFKSLGLFSIVFTILFQLRFSFNYYALLDLMSFTSLACVALLMVTGVVFFFVRNLSFTVWEPTYPSLLAEYVGNGTSLDNALLLSIHAGLTWTLVRFYFSWIAQEKYTDAFLLKPLGHYLGTRQLNQENIFIAYYIFVLACHYTFLYVSKRYHVIKINQVQQSLWSDIKTSFATLLCQSSMTAIHSFLFAYVTYILFNRSIYHVVARLFGIFYKLLDSPIIGFDWHDIHLMLRCMMAGSMTISTFNFIHRLYNISYGSRMAVTDGLVNQFDVLIDGLEGQKEIQMVAFAELAMIATKQEETRHTLFRTVGKDVQDTAWYRIMRACLKVMDELRTKMDIEYYGVSVPVTPAMKPVEPPSSNQPRLQLSEGDIYARHQTKYTALDDRTKYIFYDVAERMETNLVPNTAPRLTTCAQKITQTRFVEFIKTLELKAGLGGTLEPLYGETVLRRVQTVFSKYQLVIWAIQSVASLTSHSLHEDPYGYVQNNIADVLNALLGLLVNVEKYIQTPPLGYHRLLKQQEQSQEAEAVVLATREAIYQIRTTFDEFLDHFSIDRKYSNQWQRFLDYQEL